MKTENSETDLSKFNSHSERLINSKRTLKRNLMYANSYEKFEFEQKMNQNTKIKVPQRRNQHLSQNIQNTHQDRVIQLSKQSS